MAHVFPFRALRYNQERVRAADVVTQPYDKITPAMQSRYYEASPYNLVRIILGRVEPDDNGRNVYTRATEHYQQWRRDGVLVEDPAPAIYVYSQRFSVPGDSQRVLERRGFIALGQLEDYSRGVIFRHEQTLSAPKADRLNLLRATGAHFEQIFMLYSDPEQSLDAALSSSAPPEIDVLDEYGVQHRMWRMSDAAAIQKVQAAMEEKKLIIADGHHRYETALNYRNERRASTGSAGAQPSNAPYERMMMTFVNMDASELLILPTHRVVHDLPNFQGGEFVRMAREFFSFEQIPGEPEGHTLANQIAEDSDDATVLAAVTQNGSWILRARPGAADSLLAGLSPRQRRLDVVQLHRVLLENVLGICEEAIRAQTNVAYLRDAAEAVARVRGGAADVAFLMNPASIAQVRDVAFAGEVLPQKSTDFYPKLLSGLTVYAME
jgi:uncharacterized protein (DUF1015 family)